MKVRKNLKFRVSVTARKALGKPPSSFPALIKKLLYPDDGKEKHCTSLMIRNPYLEGHTVQSSTTVV